MHTAAAAPPPAAPDTDAPLQTIAAEARQQLAADCLIVAAYGAGAADRLVCAGNPGAIETEEMRRCAAHATLGVAVAGSWFTATSSAGEILTTPIAVADGWVTVTALYRQPTILPQAEIQRSAANLLRLLVPFFALWSERLATLRQSRGFTAALNKGNVGVMLADRYGRITFANTIATAILAEGTSIRRVDQALVARTFADTLRLQAAIEHVTSPDRRGLPQGTNPAPVLALDRGGRRALMVAILAADEGEGEGDTDRLAIVYLFDPEGDMRPCLGPVCKLYGLSPVEAKLACLLADGLSLGEAAERMRVRELTARSYLKQVFLKTDTKRQAELVWLMLKSMVRTATDGAIGLI